MQSTVGSRKPYDIRGVKVWCSVAREVVELTIGGVVVGDLILGKVVDCGKTECVRAKDPGCLLGKTMLVRVDE
jgi:hypothetical protein